MNPAYEPPREGVRVADRYLLKSHPADRGLGDVWLAHDVRAGDVERIIKLHPLGAATAKDAQDLVARLTRADAKGIAAVLDGGVWEGRLFLVHQPCAGRSLRNWLDGWSSTLTSPTQATLKTVFLALCSVLQDAHGKGLVLERLNPRSVVITSIKAPIPTLVFDSGVGGFLSGDDQAACVSYLSPEQVERSKRGGASDPKRADLFALGVILAEMLTLRSTPRAGTRETWEQLVRGNPRKPLAALMPRPDDAPEEVWRLVDRLLLQRNDDELSNPSKIRQAAKSAWEAASAREGVPDSLREAPEPVEVSPRAMSTPPREPRIEARSEPMRASPAPLPPTKAGVVQVFSVDTPKRSLAPVEAPRVERAVAGPAAPVVASTPPRSASAPIAKSSSPLYEGGGDTLLDFDDDASTALANRPIVPVPKGFAPKPAPTQDIGGDTLPFDEGAFIAPAASAPTNDSGATLLFDPPGARKTPPSAAPATPFDSHLSPSDPFASMKPRGGDTLPVDDARSPLMDALIKPSKVTNQTLAAASPASSGPMDIGQTVDFAPVAQSPFAFTPEHHAPQLHGPPGGAGDTLPFDVGVAPFQPIRPVSPSPPQRPMGPGVNTNSTTQVIAKRNVGGEASSWMGPKLVAGVVTAGVLLGVLITLALRR